VLEALTDENRDAVFREMQAGRTARREFLDRILQSTIERAALVNMKELQAQKAGAEKKLAELLRAMNRKSRFGLLERISQDDPDTAARIRDQLYSTQDILGMESRSVQKLLGRVDTATLAKVLKDAGSAMQDKIMANLSKRACAALKEEMEYSGQVEDEAKKEASLRIVRAIMEMDEKGEVAFDS
jgi:flagellar motor switch protein FliG